ncbi:MAG: metal-dependent hydrolase [Thermoplasmatota archaeon]
MNKKAHLFGGMVFFFLGILLIVCVRNLSLPTADLVISFFEKSALIGSALGFAAVIFGAVLPDILDPPFSRKHRRFAHSKVLFVIMLILYMVTLFSITYRSMNDELGIWAIHFFLLGYLSHLILDSFTPAGLW